MFVLVLGVLSFGGGFFAPFAPTGVDDERNLGGAIVDARACSSCKYCLADWTPYWNVIGASRGPTKGPAEAW